jgi:hypothetical protein
VEDDDTDILGIYDRAVGYDNINAGRSSSSSSTSSTSFGGHPANSYAASSNNLNSVSDAVDYADEYYDESELEVRPSSTTTTTTTASLNQQRGTAYGGEVVDEDFAAYNGPMEGAEVRPFPPIRLTLYIEGNWLILSSFLFMEGAERGGKPVHHRVG